MRLQLDRLESDTELELNW